MNDGTKKERLVQIYIIRKQVLSSTRDGPLFSVEGVQLALCSLVHEVDGCTQLAVPEPVVGPGFGPSFSIVGVRRGHGSDDGDP